MKKNYLSPEAEILIVDSIDILTSSFDVVASGNLDTNNPDEVIF